MKDYTDNIRSKSVLITGGLGFVGSNLVRKLVNAFDCRVTVVDDLSNSSKEVLADIKDKINIEAIDVMDDSMYDLMKGKNFVFHMACMQISSSGNDPFGHLRVNAESTLKLLEYIRHNPWAEFERFVYTGSTSIYGSSVKLPVTEDDPAFVLSNYAATKLLGEQFTSMYCRNYGISASCVRYSNVYGPGQTPNNPYCGVLGKFIHNALTDVPLTVIGDGEQTRDYTYIDDAVNATILAAVHPRAFGDVFNIGTSVETSVNELVEYVSENIPSVRVDYIPERDIDNIRRRAIDITKIHNNLGWSPNYNVKKGVSQTIKWYKEYVLQ